MLSNWFVAIGTLALALATFWAIRENIKSRVDTSSPRLIVTLASVGDSPFHPSAMAGASPKEVDPGIEWDMTQRGDVRLGVSAHIEFTNEGARTAWVFLDTATDVEVTGIITDDPDSPTELPALYTRPPEGGTQLRPGQTGKVLAMWWKSASEWSRLWNPQAPSPTTTLTLRSRNTEGTIEDRCPVTFGSYVVVPRARRDGWEIASRSSSSANPTIVPGPIARIDQTRRTYRLLMPGPLRKLFRRS